MCLVSLHGQVNERCSASYDTTHKYVVLCKDVFGLARAAYLFVVRIWHIFTAQNQVKKLVLI